MTANTTSASLKALIAALALAAGAVTAPTRAAAPWRADAENTRGWQLMTPEERLAHQATIRRFDNLAACRAYQAEHHRAMDERAKQQGRRLAPERRDLCAHLLPPSERR